MYFIVINNRETYLVDKINADIASRQFLDDEKLNFSHFAWDSTKDEFKGGYDLRIMSIKNSFITHFEIRESVSDTKQGRKHQ